MRRLAAAVALLVAAVPPARLGAQAGAECATVECARSPQGADAASAAVRQLWAQAGDAHELKLRFVDALRQFTEAQAGTFGDEGPALIASVEAMRTSLARWDAAVRAIATAAARGSGADVHVVLGTVYLDRLRAADAVRELTAAARLDDGRPDVLASLALAHGLAGQPQEAARALKTATALDADNAALAYSLALRARELRRQDDVLQALRRVTRLRSAASPASRAATPFERVDLIRQASGVLPVFPMPRYAAGFAALDRGDLEAAVDRLAAAVVEDPLVSTPADVARGAGLLRAGQVGAALAVLEPIALDAASGSEARRVYALAAWVGGDHNRAIAQLRAAVERAPGDDRARMALAFVLRAADRPSEADVVLRDAIAAQPAAALAQYQRGLLHESQSRLPDAAEALEASAAQPPVIGRDHLYQRLGRVKVNQAAFDGAIAAYETRVGINPNSGEAHRSLGEIYYLQGRDEEALAEFLVAAWLDPADARVLTAAGQVHLRAQRYQEAAAALTRAVALDPARADARYALGQALIRSGRAAEGAREIEAYGTLQADERAAGQRDFRLEQLRAGATRAVSTGAGDEAVATLQQIAVEDSRNPRWPRELGAVLLRLRRPQEAIAALNAAQALQPSAEGHQLLADAYALAGMAAESRAQLALAEAARQRRRLVQLRALDPLQ
jgi:tetratricopeptide (TPR) repeat protein